MVERIGDKVFLTPEEQVLAGVWQESFTVEEVRELGGHMMAMYQEAQSEIDSMNRNVFPDSFVLDENNARYVAVGDAFRRYALGQDLLLACRPDVEE